MPYAWHAILHNAAAALSDAAGVSVSEDELSPTPDPKLGDVAFGTFKLAKAQGRPPADIARELAEKVGKGDHSIESASAFGPYVNLTFKPGDLITRVVSDVESAGDSYGDVDAGGDKRLMLEYAQPNTHKEIHVGHLRNLTLGASLDRILTAAGWDVVAASYHGDIGAHVAKCLWLFVRRYASHVQQPKPKRLKKGETPPEPLSDEAWADHLIADLSFDAVEEMLKAIPREERTGNHLGQLYAESTKLLDENPDWKAQVSEVQRKLEGQDEAWGKLWQETRRWSLDEFDEIFQDLGVKIGRRYLESEVADEGQKIVDKLLAEGVARQSEGAIIVDLEDQKLGVFLVRKSDGTTLYATKDLALAFLKLREYPDLARSLILVDNRQSFYFKQLFATLKLMGIEHPMEFVGYEFVTLKSGAMSSREGNIVTWQSFRNEVLQYAMKETHERHPDWNEGRVAHTAWCLMMGGVKFGMLRQDSDKVYVFDAAQALAFDGATGPYVQYAATRLASILSKAKWNPEAGRVGEMASLEHPAEKRLALVVAALPDVIARAAKEMRPGLVAQWSFEAASRVNEFYRDVNVIESPDGTREARLRLVAAARQALVRGLILLGIPVPEEM